MAVTAAEFALAISGAALAVSLLSLAWSIFWSVWQHRQATRPMVAVRATLGMPTYEGGHLGDVCIDLTAVNEGAVPVTLTSVAFGVPGATHRAFVMAWVFQSPAPLPRAVGPGEHWHAMTDLQDLLGALAEQVGQQRRWKLIITVSDAAGHDFTTTLHLDPGWQPRA